MIKWVIQSLVGLLAVFVIGYLLIALIWEFLWIGFLLWIIGYIIYRKNGIIGNGYTLNKKLFKKYLWKTQS